MSHSDADSAHYDEDHEDSLAAYLDRTAESEAESRAKLAYRLIEEMIVTLQLPPGSRVSENRLSAELGIGRTPIREALQRLAYERTVRILPRAGAIVSQIDVVDQLNLIEIRREIERIIARRAARLASRKDREAFEYLAEDFDAAARNDDEKLFMKSDRRFNNLIVQSAQNNYAELAMGPIQAQTRRFWYLHFQNFGDIPTVSLLHAAVARAVVAGEEDAAGRTSDALLDYVEEYTNRTIRCLT